jgi:hypothetical protein
MAILSDLPPESALCLLCDQPATGTLAAPAVVDPAKREHMTPAVMRHVRRVLSEGIALCESCGTACSYDIGRTDSEIGGES